MRTISSGLRGSRTAVAVAGLLGSRHTESLRASEAREPPTIADPSPGVRELARKVGAPIHPSPDESPSGDEAEESRRSASRTPPTPEASDSERLPAPGSPARPEGATR